MKKQIYLILSYVTLINLTFASTHIIASNDDDDIKNSLKKTERMELQTNQSFQSDEDIFAKMTTSAKKTVYNLNYLSKLKSYFWKDNDGNITVTE